MGENKEQGNNVYELPVTALGKIIAIYLNRFPKSQFEADPKQGKIGNPEQLEFEAVKYARGKLAARRRMLGLIDVEAGKSDIDTAGHGDFEMMTEDARNLIAELEELLNAYDREKKARKQEIPQAKLEPAAIEQPKEEKAA